MIGYYTATGTKPASPTEILERVKQIAPSVKTMVDELAGTGKEDDSTKAVNPADYPDDGSVTVPGMSDKELKW